MAAVFQPLTPAVTAKQVKGKKVKGESGNGRKRGRRRGRGNRT